MITPTAFFFQKCLAILVASPLHINYQIILSIHRKGIFGDFDRNVLNLYINLDRINIIAISLPIHEHGVSLHLSRSSLIFIHQYFVVLEYKSYTCRVGFTPNYIILSDYIWYCIFISVSTCSLLAYRNKFLYVGLIWYECMELTY